MIFITFFLLLSQKYLRLYLLFYRLFPSDLLCFVLCLQCHLCKFQFFLYCFQFLLLSQCSLRFLQSYLRDCFFKFSHPSFIELVKVFYHGFTNSFAYCKNCYYKIFRKKSSESLQSSDINGVKLPQLLLAIHGCNYISSTLSLMSIIIFSFLFVCFVSYIWI